MVHTLELAMVHFPVRKLLAYSTRVWPLIGKNRWFLATGWNGVLFLGTSDLTHIDYLIRNIIQIYPNYHLVLNEWPSHILRQKKVLH